LDEVAILLVATSSQRTRVAVQIMRQTPQGRAHRGVEWLFKRLRQGFDVGCDGWAASTATGGWQSKWLSLRVPWQWRVAANQPAVSGWCQWCRWCQWMSSGQWACGWWKAWNGNDSISPLPSGCQVSSWHTHNPIAFVCSSPQLSDSVRGNLK